MTSFPSIKTILAIEKKPSQCQINNNIYGDGEEGKEVKRGGMSLQSVPTWALETKMT